MSRPAIDRAALSGERRVRAVRCAELSWFEECRIPAHRQLRCELPHRGLRRCDEIFEAYPDDIAGCGVPGNHASIVLAELTQVSRNRVDRFLPFQVTLQGRG